jgi:DNA mismatch repair protein MLH3
MYLHELEATAGTAKQPPRLPALLASKACRSAVMFGDELSNEQSSALISKLRRTRRFDICAHGRPTLAPLLDVGMFEALRSSALP